MFHLRIVQYLRELLAVSWKNMVLIGLIGPCVDNVAPSESFFERFFTCAAVNKYCRIGVKVKCRNPAEVYAEEPFGKLKYQ